MIAKMTAQDLRCSFCGKSRGEVTEIVAGTPQGTRGVPRRMIGKSSFICNECVHRFNQLLSSAEISGVPQPV
jgi:hypothetical protein